MAAVTPQTRTCDPGGLLERLDGRYGGHGDACGIPDELLAAPIGLRYDGETPD
jgi:hypothetical protein